MKIAEHPRYDDLKVFIEDMMQKAEAEEKSQPHPREITEEMRQRFREHNLAGAEKLLDDIDNPEILVNRVLQGALDPSNPATRHLFTLITGVTIPRTHKGTVDAVRQYVGGDKWDALVEARRVARETKRAQEEAEKQAKRDAETQQRMEKIREAIVADKTITGDGLLEFARHIGFDVHPRTAGTLKKRVHWIQAGKAGVSGGTRLSDGVWEVFHAVKAKVCG